MTGPATTAALQIGSGFTDATLQSQAAFRLILGAMSRPGNVVALDGLSTVPPGLGIAAAVTLLHIRAEDALQ